MLNNLAHWTLTAAAAAAKSLQSCLTLCDPIDWQPARLPCPWDSPGKNTGVGCHFLLQCVKVKRESEVAQSCLTLSEPMDCSPPGFSIHGIFQEYWSGLPLPSLNLYWEPIKEVLITDSLVAQMVKRLPAMQETWLLSLGQEDPLEKEMATHSRTLAWKIPGLANNHLHELLNN